MTKIEAVTLALKVSDAWDRLHHPERDCDEGRCIFCLEDDDDLREEDSRKVYCAVLNAFGYLE